MFSLRWGDRPYALRNRGPTDIVAMRQLDDIGCRGRSGGPGEIVVWSVPQAFEVETVQIQRLAEMLAQVVVTLLNLVHAPSEFLPHSVLAALHFHRL